MNRILVLLITALMASSASASSKVHLSGRFIVGNPDIYCQIVQVTSDANQCSQQRGQVLPAHLVFDGTTGDILIKSDPVTPVKFETLLTNLSGKMAHYSPPNDVVLLRDLENKNMIHVYRSSGKRYLMAGYFMVHRNR